LTEQNVDVESNNQEIKIDAELLAELKRKFPEWFAGTPEWQLKVRIEAAAKLYHETGFIIME